MKQLFIISIICISCINSINAKQENLLHKLITKSQQNKLLKGKIITRARLSNNTFVTNDNIKYIPIPETKYINPSFSYGCFN